MRGFLSKTIGLALALTMLASAQTVLRPSSASILAEQKFQNMLSSHKVRLSRRQDYTSRVSAIGENLARVARRPIPWNFYVIDDKTPNAFTPGEGVVIITEGLLNLQLDEDELAGVLAHEVAHGTERHGEADSERATRVQAELLSIKKEYNDLKADKKAGRIDDDIYQSKANFLVRRAQDLEQDLNYMQSQRRFKKQLLQENEIAADLAGMRFAVAAGYKAEGLQGALNKILQKNIEQFGDGFTGEGETHPSTETRLRILKEVQLKYYGS